MPAYPALALLEFDSIAIGIYAGDAMIKKAPIAEIYTGTVQPGHYLAMAVGEVAVIEEALTAGLEAGQNNLCDSLFLPHAHPNVIEALRGNKQMPATDALGIIETKTVPAAIRAADAGSKGAQVNLIRLRLADGLGGKGLSLFAGLVADVEAAVEIASEQAKMELIQQMVIPQLHAEMISNVHADRFGDHFTWESL